MAPKHSSIRAVIDRILDVIQDTCDLEADIRVSGSKLVLSADLNRASSRPIQTSTSGELPTEDQLFEGIQGLGSKATLTRLAKSFGVKPRQKLKRILNRLVKEKRIRKAGLAYRADDGLGRRGRRKRRSDSVEQTVDEKPEKASMRPPPVTKKAAPAKKPQERKDTSRKPVDAPPPQTRKPVKARRWTPPGARARMAEKVKENRPEQQAAEKPDGDDKGEEKPEAMETPDAGEERAVTAQEEPAPAMV